ncbi:nucleotidyltransferase family protein [Sphingobium sp. Z007]|uniref:nucleotidyltransferase family protein n=1 Tax=Sphingobium sp. Z007 TaxID=627495 RepID=UPI000B49EA5C|nr:sugar phosphate nucleotidyltransferase [Sphingobium sp. Z007]
MKVVILCGGQGIRAFPFTTYLPKPMLPLGGTPVLVHVIKNFIRQGFRDFILAAGYRQDVLHDYFEGKDIGASVQIVDTGEDADTGRRIWNCRHLIDGPFIATYGDGLSDVPLDAVVAFHRAHGARLTITSVPMYSQYGVLSVEEDGAIARFAEKPLIADYWINAGFMVMDPAIFADWQGENLERDIIPPLIARGDAFTYRHDGFFKSFDFYKDVVEMDETLAAGGPPPWIAPALPQERAA